MHVRYAALLWSLIFILGARSALADSVAPIPVVAAENVWGSIVAQLGGARVHVLSVISDPNADPHEFESDMATARAVADARYIVVNGVGYDSWMEKLMAANPGTRDVLRAADVVDKHAGDNPHLWYEPMYVARIADRISADLERIDPAGITYYREQRVRFAAACRPYQDVIASIRTHDRDRHVGATEDIVAYLIGATGLHLSTPPAFMQAVSNGTEPPVAAVLAVHRQIDSRAIAVLLYNVQTSTAMTSEIRSLAIAKHIPVVPLTETVVPANGRFEDWQLHQLELLQAALRP